MDNQEETVMLDFSDFSAPVKFKKSRSEIRRSVNEYTSDGMYLHTYSSIREAIRESGLSVSLIEKMVTGKVPYSVKHDRIFLYRGDDIAVRMKLVVAAKEAKKRGRPVPVCEYTLTGRLVFVHPSQKLAAKTNHLSTLAVSNCCRGKTPYIGNRIFLNQGDDISSRLPAVREALYRERMRRRKYRQVDEYTLDGTYVRAFPSCSAASREYGIHVSHICRCCNGIGAYGRQHLTAGGKIFLWTGSSISDRLEVINSKKNSYERSNQGSTED